MEEDKRILNEEEAANVSGGFVSTYQCPQCKAIFKSYKEYSDHLVTRHMQKTETIKAEPAVPRDPNAPPLVRP